MDITLFQRLNIPAEADRIRVYDDATGKTIGPGTLVVGNPTIAIGRNVGPTGPGLRQTEIVSMLANDETEVEREAKAFAWYPHLDPIRQTVVCSMIFNMGLGKFGLTDDQGFKDLHHALALAVTQADPMSQATSWQAASAAMLASKWALAPPAGVGDRAKALASIMLSGAAP